MHESQGFVWAMAFRNLSEWTARGGIGSNQSTKKAKLGLPSVSRSSWKNRVTGLLKQYSVEMDDNMLMKTQGHIHTFKTCINNYQYVYSYQDNTIQEVVSRKLYHWQMLSCTKYIYWLHRNHRSGNFSKCPQQRYFWMITNHLSETRSYGWFVVTFHNHSIFYSISWLFLLHYLLP